MDLVRVSHPILSCDDARAFESRLFAGDEAKEWSAMQQAGRAIGGAVLQDFEEIGGFPPEGRVLVLVGKGHNGGDALIATRFLLEKFPQATADVVFAFGERTLRPLAARAWRDLVHAASSRVRGSAAALGRRIEDQPNAATPPTYDLCLDGIFGFHFRPPMDEAISALIAHVNKASIRLRAAIDLPSGLSEKRAPHGAIFRADFSYATGSVKRPLIDGSHGESVGRLRYLDLGFFDASDSEGRLRVLTPQVLAPLRALRASESDKRTYGHVMVVAGSRSYPGAAMMTVLAALRSGAGLVTAFVPESLVPAFAARAPEAMWHGWPETSEGWLSSRGLASAGEKFERATALVLGPGLGRDREAQTVAFEMVKQARVPLVIDADALQPEIVRAGKARRVLTPHLGELKRILAGDDFYETAAGREAVVVVKGRLTAVTQGGRMGFYSPFGGPVLARGGSGDALAGLIGGLLAQTPDEPALAAARGVVWHGLAADALAREKGQVAARTTELIDRFPAALHGA